jgi:crossover junction endodeoxyribonuclease RuvC
LGATGYGVLEAGPAGTTVVDAGLIETGSELPLPERLRLIHDGVWRLLDKHTAAALVIEDLYTEYRFPRTALLMAHARGAVCLAAAQHFVPVMSLAPAEVKRAITGHGGAGKEQMQRGVQRLLKLPTALPSSHVADALALAFTGLGRLKPAGRPRQ